MRVREYAKEIGIKPGEVAEWLNSKGKSKTAASNLDDEDIKVLRDHYEKKVKPASGSGNIVSKAQSALNVSNAPKIQVFQKRQAFQTLLVFQTLQTF